jgi:group I intron endonuclease
MPARKDGKGYIYKITNKISGKCYIGETGQTSVKKRWDDHLSKIRKGSGCPALRDAITKYGVEYFSCDVLCTCETLEERMEKEIQYIKEYDSMAPKGYNILPGGHYSAGFLGKTHSEETKAKLSKSSKEYHAKPEVKKSSSERAKINNKKYNFRELVKNSDKFKKALEEGRVGCGKGTKMKEEVKEKIRNSVKKYFDTLDNKEKHHVNVIEHRKVMGKAVGTKVGQYNIEGNFIKFYESIAEAARCVGLKSKTSIENVIRGKGKTAAGFIWKKYEEPKDSDNLIEHV